jgi:transcriptional regulator with XRE-family HTH domain
LERLKFSRDWTDEQLADEIGVSRRMLWLNRTGKKPISAKTLWKLQQKECSSAERSAGILPSSPPSLSGMVRESPAPYEAAKENIAIIDPASELVAIARELGRLAERLTVVAKGLRVENRSPERLRK